MDKDSEGSPSFPPLPLCDLESLPSMLRHTYATMRELDRSLQALQQQNDKRCEEEIEEIRRGLAASATSTSKTALRFSDEALDEQKHCVRIAEEKVALAGQAYEMVDTQIQQLDQYLRKLEEVKQEEMARTPEGAAMDSRLRSGRGSGSGKAGRKKSAPAVEPPCIDLEIPVDPNEPTYCICNQVSYGQMVACDNPSCKIEWFHFGCVGLKEQPKGKWFCPECSALKRRRR
ncbi:RING/FYVE/PHD zinc finger superfamily protein isoform X2 [Wolffia australiana]